MPTRLMVQKCTRAALCVNNKDEWVRVGEGVIVYVCFYKNTKHDELGVVVNHILNCPQYGNNDVSMAQGQGVYHVLVVPQTSLAGKRKGVKMVYHDVVDQDHGEKLYNHFCDLFDKAAKKVSTVQEFQEGGMGAEVEKQDKKKLSRDDSLLQGEGTDNVKISIKSVEREDEVWGERKKQGEGEADVKAGGVGGEGAEGEGEPAGPGGSGGGGAHHAAPAPGDKKEQQPGGEQGAQAPSRCILVKWGAYGNKQTLKFLSEGLTTHTIDFNMPQPVDAPEGGGGAPLGRSVEGGGRGEPRETNSTLYG